MSYENIPNQMKIAERWLVYKLVPNPDPTKKPRKVPYYISGEARYGKLDTPEDQAKLSTFEDAMKALQTGDYDGLGFALGPDDTGMHWQGIDLDNFSEHPELRDLAAKLPGYVEYSPSGDGVHSIGYGELFDTLGSNGTGIEAYSKGRFFTVTGRPYVE